MLDYPIKRDLDECECDQCGRFLAVGMVALVDDNWQLFCSEACADERLAAIDSVEENRAPRTPLRVPALRLFPEPTRQRTARRRKSLPMNQPTLFD